MVDPADGFGILVDRECGQREAHVLRPPSESGTKGGCTGGAGDAAADTGQVRVGPEGGGEPDGRAQGLRG